MRSALCRLLGVVLLTLLGIVSAPAQSYQLGAQFSGMHLHKIDEAPFGIGLRFNSKLFRFVGTDAELTHYPTNPSGNFGETSALVGIRAGKSLGAAGVFGNVRPGVIHFGGAYFVERMDQRTHPMLSVGGTLEYYPNRRTFLRIEIADAVIYYGSTRLFNRLNPDALGTVHNFQPGFGFGFRF